MNSLPDPIAASTIWIGPVLIEPVGRQLRISVPAHAPEIAAILAAHRAIRDGSRARGPVVWWAPAGQLAAIERKLRKVVDPLFSR